MVEPIEYNIEVLKAIAGTDNIMELRQRLEPFIGMEIYISGKGIDRLIMDEVIKKTNFSDEVIANYLEVSKRRVKDRRKTLMKKVRDEKK